MRSGRLCSIALAGLLGLSLAGCESTDPAPEAPPVASAAPPPPPPEPQPEPEPSPPAAEPSQESLDLAVYYRRLQADLLAQGLLRGDDGAEDAPFTDTMLARNFIQVALFDEYVPSGTDLVRQRQEARLRRWDQPIRMELVFGPSVTSEQRARDRSSVSAYVARLSDLTGVPITIVEDGGNFHVLFLNEDERESFEPQLRDLIPAIASSSVRTFLNLSRDELCLVIGFAEGTSSSYSRAVALIRAEHPELIRTACIHEELAQAMGLANDSPNARPSIFNDNEEFGLLTRHDELLLRMLYDPRLRTGMTMEEAEPLVRQIASELMNPPS